MMTEKAILESITHGLIVKYYSFVQTYDKSMLFMEYVENGDLFHTMRRRKLNRKEIVFVVCELLEALEYLHS
jgi:serine/threonine protein kinase